MACLGCADAAHAAGISDLAIGGKNIVGTSIYRTRQVLFYQAGLLVSTLVREGSTGSVTTVQEALRTTVEQRLPILK